MRAGRYDDLPLVLRQSSEAQAAVHGQPPADASGATPPTPGRTALARGKWLLVIPHIIVLAVLFFVVGIVWFISIFIILFTAGYPEGLFKFVVGVLRWSNRVNVYYYLMRDEYPPFSLD